MDTSLFSKLQATNVASAHTVGTALVPKHGASSNLRSAKASAEATTGTTTGTSTATATADGSTITSNDFLTLLVSELKNQDPTQPTDPNQYISQLVGVNSLEQLISINSGITSLDTSVSAPATTPTNKAVPAESVAPAVPSQLHRPAGTQRL